MTDNAPVACSLGAGELEQRLAAIAEIGASSLLSRDIEGNAHLLRFRADATTRRRLEAIIAAEAECCSFLDLSLGEVGGELVLSIAAPRNAQALAEELAGAFSELRSAPLSATRSTSARQSSLRPGLPSCCTDAVRQKASGAEPGAQARGKRIAESTDDPH